MTDDTPRDPNEVFVHPMVDEVRVLPGVALNEKSIGHLYARHDTPRDPLAARIVSELFCNDKEMPHGGTLDEAVQRVGALIARFDATRPNGDDHDHHYDKRCETCKYLARPSGDEALRAALDSLIRAVGDYTWLANGRRKDGECYICNAPEGVMHAPEKPCGVLHTATNAARDALRESGS